jgi:hypothetical protein
MIQVTSDARAPDVHVSTSFHRTLTIFDTLSSNMSEFILRKSDLPIIHKLKVQKFEK